MLARFHKRTAAGLAELTGAGLFLALLALSAQVRGEGASLDVRQCSGGMPVTRLGLYETLDITVPGEGEFTNPFDYREVSLEARFESPEGNIFSVSGFYDGRRDEEPDNPVWRIRFMPDRRGDWTFSYAWNGRLQVHNCRFTVTARTNPLARGHVKPDPDHPGYLVHDDGTPHYWWGGKWFSASDYGPPGRNNPVSGDFEKNHDRLTDREIIAYLDLLREYRHNGILIKIALIPLRNDGLGWDLEWIRRGEWLVRAAAERGIYVQVNLFDTWSRPLDGVFELTTRGDRQVLNAWDEERLREKENYLRTVIARFAGFYNVYWELGNEMEHAPNCGTCFVALANKYYLPWIRKYDPYGLPTGLSENVWQDAAVDIGFLHQTDEYPATGQGKALIMNELVRGGVPLDRWERLLGRGAGMYYDSYIRSASKRPAYRRTFWNMFVRGGSGSSEATWLDIRRRPNAAVLAVMADQRRLRDFIEALPVNINTLSSSGSLIRSGTVPVYTRFLPGRLHVVYVPERQTPGRRDVLEMDIGPGNYVYQWYDPSSGRYSGELPLQQAGGIHRLTVPAHYDDVVLIVRRHEGKREPAAGRR